MIHYTIEDLIKEIRSKYYETFGVVLTDYIEGFDGKYSNTVEMWIGQLERVDGQRPTYDKWRKILEGIEITQNGNLALFHYVGFDVIYGDWNPVEYWGAYGGIYRTCRSTVINLYSGETVIKPFDKFFNVNELPETSQENVEKLIESAKAIEISEKLDGSIVCASRRMFSDYSGTYLKTYICTSQSLDPETSWHLAMAKSMLDMSVGIDRMLDECTDWTFMFEMIASEDAHVVYYPESERGLHLIGARTPDGRLLRYYEILELAEKFGIKTTQVFNKSFEQVMSELDDKKSDEAEGFVIRIDDEFFKLKYNDYVAMHKVINRLVSASGVIEAVKEGRIDDLIAKVPLTYKDKLLAISETIASTIDHVRTVQDIVVKECEGKELRDQMMWIQKNVPKILQGRCINAVKYSDYSFFLNNGKQTPKLRDIETLDRAATDWITKDWQPTTK